MSIRIWRSYACNNSSAYRLVARFADPAVAADAVREIAELIAAHAAELDADPQDAIAPSQAQRAIAAKYGFAWNEITLWGVLALTGREPPLVAAGTVVVLQHERCTGFEGFRRYFEARGAVVNAQSFGDEPTPVTVLFAWPACGDNAALAAAFDDLGDRVGDTVPTDGFDLVPPWDRRERSAVLAVFRDGATGGLHYELHPEDGTELATMRRWLADHGVGEPSITLCDADDGLTFPRIAAARCAACASPLRYLDPRIHDIERAQLLCPACGGLYELEVLLEDR